MPDSPAKTGRRKNGTFRKGVSGNPKGRPAGSRHSVSLALEALIGGEAEALTRQVIQQALGGDVQSLRMCMDRLYPAPKDRPINFTLPAVESLTDHPKAIGALLVAMAAGELTPTEAASFAKLLEAHANATGLAELEHRIAALENRQ
ncbi:DUF5681 domain-containing protein [Erythrobacter alti]|uniref:DUF5681 domain-containing protein n=1 Tax=Erythrobacter alti TaxID=1896145 RepID=UPI0030F3A371